MDEYKYRQKVIDAMYDLCKEGSFKNNPHIDDIIKAIEGIPLDKSEWIPVSERLPEVDEEGESNGVFIALKETIYHMYKCQRVHITKIAFYDKNAISSDGLYMNTEGWVLNDGRTLSMNEVIAWQELPELPEPYKEGEGKK